MPKLFEDRMEKIAKGNIGSIRSPHEADLFCDGYRRGIQDCMREVSVLVDGLRKILHDNDNLYGTNASLVAGRVLEKWYEIIKQGEENESSENQ